LEGEEVENGLKPNKASKENGLKASKRERLKPNKASEIEGSHDKQGERES
jgi:hypothetical protein